MKAHLPLNNKMARAYREAAFNDLYKSLQYNKAVDLIALRLAFGFGATRTRKFLKAMIEANTLLDGWRAAGILEEKLTEALLEVGIPYDYIFDESITLEEAKASITQEATVSNAECNKIVNGFTEYKHFVEDANKDL